MGMSFDIHYHGSNRMKALDSCAMSVNDHCQSETAAAVIFTLKGVCGALALPPSSVIRLCNKGA